MSCASRRTKRAIGSLCSRRTTSLTRRVVVSVQVVWTWRVGVLCGMRSELSVERCAASGEREAGRKRDHLPLDPRRLDPHNTTPLHTTAARISLDRGCPLSRFQPVHLCVCHPTHRPSFHFHGNLQAIRPVRHIAGLTLRCVARVTPSLPALPAVTACTTGGVGIMCRGCCWCPLVGVFRHARCGR